MTAEKKDRKPLQIKNLTDLKRHIKLGTEIVATSHQYHPDIVGLTRVVTKVQTNGFYSKIKDQPDHKWSTCNHGSGFWSPYSKANAMMRKAASCLTSFSPCLDKLLRFLKTAQRSFGFERNAGRLRILVV